MADDDGRLLTEIRTVIDQAMSLLGLHGCYGSPTVGTPWRLRNLDLEEAAEIAGTLADYCAVLVGRVAPEVRDRSGIGKVPALLRERVAGERAWRREAAGARELRVMVAIGWLERRFWDRREWPNAELFAAAEEDGIDGGTLFDREVKSLPIRRKRITNATGHCDWIWIAKASWPEGNTRPRGQAARRRKREG